MIRLRLRRDNGDALFVELWIGSTLILARQLAYSGLPLDGSLVLEVSDE